MRVPDGAAVGRLARGDGACAHALVQGKAVAIADGVSVIPGWSEHGEVEIVCKVAPGARVSVDGRRRTGMFVIGPGQAFSLRNGGAAEQTWTLVCAERVPVAAEPTGSCAFCHCRLGSAAVIVDATGLPPSWRALVCGPLCRECAAGIAEARRPGNGRAR
ncbi:MAG: hypothetical protein JXP73_16820 [Deltaproteobacteria bacterium]|nr:hypothetical protein [Deltaproteobacteria bacterium]